MGRFRWVRNRIRTSSHDGIEMIREARTVQRRKCGIGQGEGLRIGSVVWNVRLIELAHGHVIATDISVLHQVKLIHQAAVDRGGCVLPSMSHVAHSIWSMLQQNDLSVRDRPASRTIGAGEGSKIVIEGSILLNDEDNVLDNVNSG